MLCVFLFKVCVGQKFLPWYICSFACTLYLVSVLLLIYFQNQLLEVMSWNILCFFMHTHRYRHTHIHTFLPTTCSNRALWMILSYDFPEAYVSHECKPITFPSPWRWQASISEDVFSAIRSLKLKARYRRVNKALYFWHLALEFINLKNRKIWISWNVSFGFYDKLNKVFEVYS